MQTALSDDQLSFQTQSQNVDHHQLRAVGIAAMIALLLLLRTFFLALECLLSLGSFDNAMHRG
jgi:hypothetical protein